MGALLAGFCSGLSAGMLGVPGPPLMVFISVTGLDKSLSTTCTHTHALLHLNPLTSSANPLTPLTTTVLATVATVNLATAAPQAAILAARGVVALSDWPL